MARRTEFALILLTFSTMVGCGPDGPRTYGFSGTVSYQGQPLTGTISFYPVEGEARRGTAAGAAVVDGVYEVEAEYGLLPGSYRVELRREAVTAEGIPEADLGKKSRSSQQLPGRFNTESELRAEITPNGSNQFDFHLD